MREVLNCFLTFLVAARIPKPTGSIKAVDVVFGMNNDKKAVASIIPRIVNLAFFPNIFVIE